MSEQMENIETLFYDKNIGVVKATKESLCRINFRTRLIDYLTLPLYETNDPLHFEIVEWARIDQFHVRKMYVPRTAIQCCIDSIRENPDWLWK